MEQLSDDFQQRERGILICPDISPFASSIDGTVITGRRALRDHNKRHDVTNPADFTNTWATAAKQRDAMFSGDNKFDRKRRVTAIRDAYERHAQRRR